MSNNIQNRLKIVGTEKQIEEVLNSIKGEKEIIDFDKIIPMPKELDIESGGDSDTGLSVIKQKLGVNINPIEKYYVDKFDNLDEESKDRILRQVFLASIILSNMAILHGSNGVMLIGVQNGMLSIPN